MDWFYEVICSRYASEQRHILAWDLEYTKVTKIMVASNVNIGYSDSTFSKFELLRPRLRSM